MGDQFDAQPVTEAEVKEAVQMLREGFAFVGLTEELKTSVCLMHKMFGGQCDQHSFFSAHYGTRHANSSYDVSELKGFRDIADGVLYAEALEIFSENLRLYDVSAETCEP